MIRILLYAPAGWRSPEFHLGSRRASFDVARELERDV
jgi:hypothetical protein